MKNNKYNNLNEQLERMKSLMTEDRLYGNLVDKNPTIKEQLKKVISDLMSLISSNKINMKVLTKSYDEALTSALKNTDEVARVAALRKIADGITSGTQRSNTRKFLKKLGIIDEEAINEFMTGMEKMQLMILKGLKEKKTLTQIAEGYRPWGIEYKDVETAVALFFDNNTQVKRSLGLGEEKLLSKADQKIKNQGKTSTDVTSRLVTTHNKIVNRYNSLSKLLDDMPEKELTGGTKYPDDPKIKPNDDGSINVLTKKHWVQTSINGLWFLLKSWLFHIRIPKVTKILDSVALTNNYTARIARRIIRNSPWMMGGYSFYQYISNHLKIENMDDYEGLSQADIISQISSGDVPFPEFGWIHNTQYHNGEELATKTRAQYFVEAVNAYLDNVPAHYLIGVPLGWGGDAIAWTFADTPEIMENRAILWLAKYCNDHPNKCEVEKYQNCEDFMESGILDAMKKDMLKGYDGSQETEMTEDANGWPEFIRDWSYRRATGLEFNEWIEDEIFKTTLSAKKMCDLVEKDWGEKRREIQEEIVEEAVQQQQEIDEAVKKELENQKAELGGEDGWKKAIIKDMLNQEFTCVTISNGEWKTNLINRGWAKEMSELDSYSNDKEGFKKYYCTDSYTGKHGEWCSAAVDEECP